MRDEHTYIAAAAIILLVAVLYALSSPPAAAPTPTPPPATTPSPVSTPAQQPTQSATATPIPQSPTPPSNFEAVWNMSSLEFNPYLPASSFPEPPPKIVRTNGSLITIGGKPLIVIFTLSACSHCAWEKPAFYNATGRFGTWNGSSFTSGYIVARSILSDTAPFEYQPLFMNYSYHNLVPLTLLGGVYSRTGSNEQHGVDDATARAEEADRLTEAICMLFAVGEKPPACPP